MISPNFCCLVETKPIKMAIGLVIWVEAQVSARRIYSHQQTLLLPVPTPTSLGAPSVCSEVLVTFDDVPVIYSGVLVNFPVVQICLYDQVIALYF